MLSSKGEVHLTEHVHWTEQSVVIELVIVFITRESKNKSKLNITYGL